MTTSKARSVQGDRLLREPAVLEIMTLCRSIWWAGIKDGIYPPPLKISPRVSAWRASDIDSLLERLSAEAATAAQAAATAKAEAAAAEVVGK